MNNYVGITIGPIVETMMQTSTPAGLWYASYFFSSITRDICIELQEKGYDILSLPMEKPSWDKRYRVEEHKNDNEGIGSYHDRIYFETDRDWEKDVKVSVNDIIESVIGMRASELEICIGEQGSDIQKKLKEFLKIHYICLSERIIGEKGVVSSLADALDTLELDGRIMKCPENNPLYKVIKGKKESSNYYLKKLSVMETAIEKNRDHFRIAEKCKKDDRQDSKEEINVHDIEWIASCGKKDKRKAHGAFPGGQAGLSHQVPEP